MKRVLHITADYPDACSTRKTQAVRNLVKGATQLEHCVYSINRQNGFGGITELERRADLSTLVYQAPKYGVFLETFLKPLADWIIADSRNDGRAVDLIHGHKLTVEGLVARRVSDALGCPYVCTVRGNTDQKYLRFKPTKRVAYSRVAESSALLLLGAPWVERDVLGMLSLHNVRTALFPTITGLDRFLPPRTRNGRFVTAFHLDNWRLKGMRNLLRAIALLKRKQLDIGLDIIGGGSERATKELAQEIRKRGVGDQVVLRGPVQHEKIPGEFNQYAAFVLPTLRESFGMVYVEALFSGIPILYSEGRGIDGYFNDQDVGVRCNPRSSSSVARGLEELSNRAPSMKLNIGRLQREGGFDRFRMGHVCARYTRLVKSVCEQGAA